MGQKTANCPLSLPHSGDIGQLNEAWAKEAGGTEHLCRSARNPSMHGESLMTFEEVVDQASAILQRRGRVTYRLLKRQFNWRAVPDQDL